MKSTYQYKRSKKMFFIGLSLASILIATSCNKFLDVLPKSQVSDGTLWTNTGNADLFLNGIYASLPRAYNTADPIDNYSDDSMNDLIYEYSRSTFAMSNFDASNGPNQWQHFANIRKCNLFISKAEQSQLPDDWKKKRLAEARFLRAYFYHILWMNHGGVPIIKDVLNYNEQGDEIFRARATSEEVFTFINEELEEISDELPERSDIGRATKGAVLTLKGWCELFWASALNNPSNDKVRWEKAAQTNQQVIDLGLYDLFSDYQAMFYEENNNNIEEIFSRQYLGGTTLGGSREGLTGPSSAGEVSRSYGGVRPTQNLVDAYFMANGLPITDPASGYNPQDPYKNREKRFYQSISYNGAEWLGFEMVYVKGSGSKNEIDLSDGNFGSNTGYDLVKGMNPKYAIQGDQKLNSANQKFFRFAEVLLSYAEARNEAYGPDLSVYESVNQVRQRSELPPLKAGMTQSEMRRAIRQERRVELAFEQKRLFDLFRWKTAEVELNGNLKGMKIEKRGNDLFYTVIDAAGGKRSFYPEKNYVFPIPQTAIDRNKNLVQNPNY